MSHVERDILLGVVGSHAYGMDTPDSDVDKLGIVQYNTRSLLKFSPPEESQVSHNPDVTRHELGKFVKLALKVNPTITELLWLTEYELITPTGAELIDMRGMFLSKKYVRDAYLGYATSQLTRLENRGALPNALQRTQKHARHIGRLLHQGYELYTTGSLSVRLSSDLRANVFEFGEHVASDPSLGKLALARYVRAFDEARSPLPSTPGTFRIQQWLLDKRRDFWE